MKIHNSELTYEDVESLGWIKSGPYFEMKGNSEQGTWTMNVNWRTNIFCSDPGEPASFCGYIKDANALGIIMISLDIPNALANYRNLRIETILK